MVQTLLRDISQYFDYLQEQGYYVAFHNAGIPMDNCMSWLTPYNINSNPFCLLVKSSPQAWNHCIQRQKKVFAACTGGPFCGMCYAGMSEFVFPIRGIDGQTLAFLSVSGYRTNDTGAMMRISATAARYGQSERKLRESYERDLIQELPDIHALSVKMAPLCRMFELLNVLVADHASGTVENTTHSSILSHAVVYLRRHYTEPVSVSDLAEICHCSVSSLSHMFKQTMGMSIRAYLQQLRLADAKRLLRDSDLPIGIISDLLGYGNPNYFSNVFREDTGESPTVYRQRCRNKAKGSGQSLL